MSYSADSKTQSASSSGSTRAAQQAPKSQGVALPGGGREAGGEAPLGNKRKPFHPSPTAPTENQPASQSFNRLRRLRETDKRRAAGIALHHIAAAKAAALEEQDALIDAGRCLQDDSDLFDAIWARVDALPSGKVGLCGMTQIREVETEQWVGSRKSQGGTAVPNAYFTGVQRCGLGFLCPDCGFTKMETMRSTLNDGIAVARRLRLRLVMITLTTRHARDEAAADVYARIATAFSRLKRLKAWTRMMQRVQGFAWVLEWTWSVSGGFHPHFHVVMAVRADSQDEAEELARSVQPAYMRQLDRAGGDGTSPAAWEHAFDVSGAEAVGNYMAKWGTAEELTKGHAKDGAGMPPMRLLRESWAARSQDTRNRAAAVWWEIACAMKHKSQLYVSEGWTALAARFPELFPEEQEDEPPAPVRIQGFGSASREVPMTDAWMWARRRRLSLTESAEEEIGRGKEDIATRVNARATLGPTDDEIVAEERRIAREGEDEVIDAGQDGGAVASGGGMSSEEWTALFEGLAAEAAQPGGRECG